ncbi:hypothetical protein CEUSTIGMA_g5538.t1 [Chlamydomonas eustigma]|uniref:ADP,ATP carrier protein n=1 Tax=Chlamydomonas eustigma TaxID=1157962 RepID=A0A250X4X2_9CHLO|nr:hypothetical protein CEUSTIGMA_g5538.t1 [Chlamydomonas eustigma]|eukprot:GAX78096.1 hypothetical protein CEUSTIGMA_g5538.t1 [Chlamydomonas eustigma]
MTVSAYNLHHTNLDQKPLLTRFQRLQVTRAVVPASPLSQRQLTCYGLLAKAPAFHPLYSVLVSSRLTIKLVDAFHTRHPTRCQAAAAAPPSSEGQSPLDIAKIASLGVMFFCSCFNYTLLQNMKDSLIVTSAGAEALPFLGAYAVLPASILFYMYHSYLVKALPEKMVYYASLAPFLAFYALFASVLYPLAPMLQPFHLLEQWQAMLPQGLVGLASIAVNWLYSLFFVFGELWGGVAISLLFWGLADDVCTMKEAKGIYPALGMLANVGLIVGGAWAKYVNTHLAGGSALTSGRWMIGTILVMAAVLFGVKAWVDERYMSSAQQQAEAEAAALERAEKKNKKTKKLEGAAGGKDAESGGNGLMGAFDVLKRSQKAGNLAVLVVAYFVVTKLFDYAWKAQMKLFYPSPVEFQAALADVTQMVGVATIAMMACSKFAFQYLGWKGTALICPVAIGVVCTVFYAAAIAAQNPALVSPALMASLILPLGAASGVIGRIITKSSKYSIFDPAKEMVYITMDRREKTEGKAAVDLLGSYFGKSGASWLTQALVLVMGTLNHALPFIAMAHAVICTAWTASTASLGELLKESEAAEAAASEAKNAAKGNESQEVALVDDSGSSLGSAQLDDAVSLTLADSTVATVDEQHVRVADLSSQNQELLQQENQILLVEPGWNLSSSSKSSSSSSSRHPPADERQMAGSAP